MIIFILTLISLDQLTKWLCIKNTTLKIKEIIIINPYFDLVYAWNHGISFGIFNDFAHSNNIFILINSIITLYLYKVMSECEYFLLRLSYSVIVAGALGNLIDRAVKGAVFDFIHLHYQEYSFAAFNIADSYISIGAILIVLDYCLRKKL